MTNVSNLIAACAVSVLLAGSVSAADVKISSASGKAFVDNGSGFVIAKAGSAVAAGDRVMAMAGDVVLSDASGCSVTVKPGDMLAVNGKALCASAMLPAAQSGSSRDDRRVGWVWVAGAFVAGGVIGYLIADDDDKKTSP